MKIIELSQCKTDLNFEPLKDWAAPLPVLSYEGQIIAGFSRATSDAVAVELGSSIPIEDYLKSIYQDLTAIEILLLYRAANSTHFNVNIDLLFQKFGFRLRDTYLELAETVAALDSRFRAWMCQKNIGFFDLENLLPLPETPEFLQLQNKFIEVQPGRNEGLKILETIKELHVFGTDYSSCVTATTTEKLLAATTELRYPVRTQQIQHMTAKAKKIAWPKSSQTRWNFDSDQPTLEVKLKLGSATDIEKIAKNWVSIQEQIKTEGLNPWD